MYRRARGGMTLARTQLTATISGDRMPSWMSNAPISQIPSMISFGCGTWVNSRKTPNPPSNSPATARAIRTFIT